MRDSRSEYIVSEDKIFLKISTIVFNIHNIIPNLWNYFDSSIVSFSAYVTLIMLPNIIFVLCVIIWPENNSIVDTRAVEKWLVCWCVCDISQSAPPRPRRYEAVTIVHWLRPSSVSNCVPIKVIPITKGYKTTASPSLGLVPPCSVPINCTSDTLWFDCLCLNNGNPIAWNISA